MAHKTKPATLTPCQAIQWQDKFFKRLARPHTLLDLFDTIPGVYMYIKDVESRFVQANRVVCDVIGVTHSSDLIGRTDFDFFPPAIAAQYVAEDQRVITSGESLSDQVWIVPGKNGVPRVYLCSKIPLHDRKDKVVGIAGLKRPYEFSADDSAGYSRLVSAIKFVTENYTKDIEVSDIAEHVFLSVSQLQREFSKSFGISPSRYLREVRVGVVRHLLESSDLALSNIATECGFYDQSHMTRHFKSSTGLTPLKYRQRFRVA
ncbi:AraC family transcriptional regulator [Mariniblastus sp.]|nr:AraC family transcriptional regulator [Mariniblastus sp.]MDB4372144.1 AraC family transcriptional regulator [Mariniblastus sp.]MDB4381188.1 AraC family transcriptional regulator [Mariniblastus sp.]